VPESFLKPPEFQVPRPNKARVGKRIVNRGWSNPLKLNYLNEIAQAIPSVITGDGVQIQKVGDRWIVSQNPNADYTAIDPGFQYFVVLDEQEDYLDCVSFSYTAVQQGYDPSLAQESYLTGSLIAVAKPPWLQQSTWMKPVTNNQPILDGIPTSFTYLGVNLRLVTPNIPTGVIKSATSASPIVITSLIHGLSTGEQISITGVQGNTAANGSWTITVIDVNTFSLNGSVANGTYTTGGNWYQADTPLPYRNPQRIQTISPPYMLGSVIVAKQSESGLMDANENPIQWIDVNDSGRNWADDSLPKAVTIQNPSPYLGANGNTYASVWDFRDNPSQIFAPQIQVWAKDLTNSISLPYSYQPAIPGQKTGTMVPPTFNGVFIGFEAGGPFWLSLKDDNTDPFYNTDSWFPMQQDPLSDSGLGYEGAPPFQLGLFYPYGNVVVYGSAFYGVSNLQGTWNQPPGSDWLIIKNLIPVGVLDLDNPQALWNYGQQAGITYEIESPMPPSDLNAFAANGVSASPSVSPQTYDETLNTYYPAAFTCGNDLYQWQMQNVINALPFTVPVPTRISELAVWYSQKWQPVLDGPYYVNTGGGGDPTPGTGWLLLQGFVYTPGEAFPGAEAANDFFYQYGTDFWFFGDGVPPAVFGPIWNASGLGSPGFNLLGDLASPPILESAGYSFGKAITTYSSTSSYQEGDVVTLATTATPASQGHTRLAIYASDSYTQPYPRTLLYQSPELINSLASETGGSGFLSVDVDLVLQPGVLYWMCGISNSLDTYAGISDVNLQSMCGMWSRGSTTSDIEGGILYQPSGIRLPYAYGPFPNTFPAVSNSILQCFMDSYFVLPFIRINQNPLQ
jgi:hypothetical protein